MIFEEGFGFTRSPDGMISFHAETSFALASEQVISEEHRNFENWNLQKKVLYLIVCSLLDQPKYPLRQSYYCKLLRDVVPAKEWSVLLAKAGGYAGMLAKALQRARSQA